MVGAVQPNGDQNQRTVQRGRWHRPAVLIHTKGCMPNPKDAQKVMKLLDADLPDSFSYDTLAVTSPPELVNLVRIELDLIDEGQEAAEAYTKRDVAKLRAFIKKWGHLHA